MNEWFSPLKMMIIGALLMIMGVVLPLFMVIKLIESTFFLAFISYAASLMGMVFAFYGLFTYVRIRRK
jgi:hypothetical protein